jgi:quinol monooxygenase YgiN
MPELYSWTKLNTRSAMKNLMAIAVFPKIEKENLERFKEVATEMLQSIRSQDSILRYELFFTLDETSCVVLEEYINPAGVFEHVEQHSKYLVELSALGGRIQGNMFPLSSEGDEISEIKKKWDSNMHMYFDGKR